MLPHIEQGAIFMPPIDLIIIVIYVIALMYVGYQALQDWVDSLEDTLFLRLDQGALDAQMEEQGLKGNVLVKVSLKDRYKYEPIPHLDVTVVNTSASAIYVDWDRSTLTNFAGRSRRVIRITPSMNINLSRPQIFSVAAPGQVLIEKIVAEDMLEPAGDGTLKITKPIETLIAGNLALAAKLFRDKPPHFLLRLALWLSDPGDPTRLEAQPRALTLKFEVHKVLGTSALPWNRKK